MPARLAVLIPWALVAASAGAVELRVGAAASLREPAQACARGYETSRPGDRVRITLGASSVLSAQVRAGAPLDVLLLADARIAEELARDGLAGAPVPFARNRLAVLVAAHVGGLAQPADLAGPAIRRIALPEHAVPIGRYAREWMTRRGLLEALAPRLVATEHARAALVAVDQGLVDVAIVYASDARLARRASLAWEIPADEQPEIVYAASVPTAARAPEAARAFVGLLLSEACRASLAQAGLRPGDP